MCISQAYSAHDDCAENKTFLPAIKQARPVNESCSSRAHNAAAARRRHVIRLHVTTPYHVSGYK